MTYLPGEAEDEVRECWERILESPMWTEGKYVDLFEREMSAYYNMNTPKPWSCNCLAVNSCGTGLFTAVKAFGVEYALVPNNTFYATGAMAQEAGVIIDLVDCYSTSPGMSIEALEATYIKGYHDCVILTHVGGSLAKDYEAIADFCIKNGLVLIEDCAHVTGVINGDLWPGKLGDAAVFSFYPTKAVPVGEGGMIMVPTATELLNYPGVYKKMKNYRNYGKFIDNGVLKYSAGGGFNFRMDEWSAAMGYVQMKRIDEILVERCEAARRLAEVVPFINEDEYTPLLENPRACNWYKFIVPASVKPIRTTGRVYARTDQLSTSLQVGDVMPHSEAWAMDHACVPVLPKVFKDMSTRTLKRYILG